MTESTAEAQVPVESELDLLKKRADMMGLKYHHRVGAVKLKAQIEAKINGQNIDADEELKKEPEVRGGSTRSMTKEQRNNRTRKEAAKLIRIRVACMNPNKKDYEGEVYTVSNSVVGTFKKYVPFNAEDGWHVPNIIYQHLKERQCQIFFTVKGPRGNKIRKGKLIKELSIEVMPALTQAELKDLAQKQAMANNLD